MSRRTTFLALVIIFLLAGCSGFSGDSAPDRESYAVSDRVNASIETEPRELLPGLTTEGVTDTRALLEAHWEAIDGRRYTVETDAEIDVEGERGDARRTSEGEMAVDPEAGVVLESSQIITEESASQDVFEIGNRSSERWLGERPLARNELGDGSVHYVNRGDATPTMDWVNASLLHSMVEGGNATVGTVDANDGAYYVIEAEENDSAESNREGTLQTVETRLLVREDGLIRQMITTEAWKGPYENSTSERRSEVSAIGETTVERPGWYDDAVEAFDDAGEGYTAIPVEEGNESAANATGENESEIGNGSENGNES